MREAAVIVLVERNTLELILTVRKEDLPSHPGEVCFPGGKRQDGDRTLYETATRELYEELGIERSRIRLLQQLQDEYTLTGFKITPWLAFLEALSPYELDTKEVESVITLPLKDVINRQNYREIFIANENKRFKSLQFLAYEQKLIWGATARIMNQLADKKNHYNDLVNFL